MAVHADIATLPAPRPAKPWYRWFGRPGVYLVLGLIVGVLAVVWAGQRAAEGVRDNLDVRLRDAGAGADAAMVTLEAEQLSALRAITFTEGIGRAIATNDIKEVNRIVAPLHANSGVPMVDIVLPSGRVVLAVRSSGAPAPVASRRGMPALEHALARTGIRSSGRFSTVVVLRSGPVVLTIGPIVYRQNAVAAVLVMTPLADALGRFSQQVGANLTAYNANGVPLATTATFAPHALTRTTARKLVGGGSIETRYAHGLQREALGRLIVDHEPVEVLGASLHDNSRITERAVMLYAGLGLLGLLCTAVLYRWRRR